MPKAIEKSVSAAQADQVRRKFAQLLENTNKGDPRPQDVKALSDMLYSHKSLELWRSVYSAGQYAEMTVIDNASAVPGVRECWRHRMSALRKDLGSDGSPLLEQLLIQQVALCWLKLNLTELSYANVMKQSITLTLGSTGRSG
jgi:hypothetical protein